LREREGWKKERKRGGERDIERELENNLLCSPAFFPSKA
jgi:hypothetical protein